MEGEQYTKKKKNIDQTIERGKNKKCVNERQHKGEATRVRKRSEEREFKSLIENEIIFVFCS